MGRRPDPAGVKAQKAPVRSKRNAPTEGAAPEVPESGLKAPSWLVGDGLAIWQKRAPVLRAQRLLQAPDELAFARYCRNFALWLKLRKKLDSTSYTYEAETTNGGKLRRADPSFLIADRIERQLLAMEDRFGLNPSERQRLVMQRAAASGQGQLPLDRKDDDAAAKPAPGAGALGILNRGSALQ